MYLAVHICQNKCLTVFPSLTSLASCAFRLSVWKLFVPIVREYCMFLLFGNSLQNSQNILFSFPSNLSHFQLSFHALILELACFFGGSRCLNSVLISLVSDDFFPPKKEYSQLVSVLTYFGSRFNSPKDDRYGPSKRKAAILYPTVHCVSSRTQTFIWQENAKHFLPACF